MILLNTETRSHRVFRYQKKINLRVFVPLCSELDKSKLFLKKHFFILLPTIFCVLFIKTKKKKI